jgi:hypothetical protein
MKVVNSPTKPFELGQNERKKIHFKDFADNLSASTLVGSC